MMLVKKAFFFAINNELFTKINSINKVLKIPCFGETLNLKKKLTCAIDGFEDYLTWSSDQYPTALLITFRTPKYKSYICQFFHHGNSDIEIAKNNTPSLSKK